MKEKMRIGCLLLFFLSHRSDCIRVILMVPFLEDESKSSVMLKAQRKEKRENGSLIAKGAPREKMMMMMMMMMRLCFSCKE